jgi:hypothetical protein
MGILKNEQRPAVELAVETDLSSFSRFTRFVVGCVAVMLRDWLTRTPRGNYAEFMTMFSKVSVHSHYSPPTLPRQASHRLEPAESLSQSPYTYTDASLQNRSTHVSEGHLDLREVLTYWPDCCGENQTWTTAGCRGAE